MGDHSCDSVEATRVLASVRSLAKRFESLCGRLITAVVEPVQMGLPPDSSVLDECRSLTIEYTVAVMQADVPHGTTIGGIIAALDERLVSHRWEKLQACVGEVLSNILRITHISGEVPEYLAEVHFRANDLRNQLQVASVDSDCSVWESKAEPFVALWRLLTEAETFSDEAAEIAVSLVEDVLGRSVVSAVVTRRLGVTSAPVEQSESEMERVVATPDKDVALSDTPIKDAGRPACDIDESGGASRGRSLSATPKSDGALVLSEEVATASSASSHDPLSVVQGIVKDSVNVEPVASLQADGSTEALKPTFRRTDAVPPAASADGIVGLAESSSNTEGPVVRSAVWRLLGADRCSLAFHICACWGDLSDPPDPPVLFWAAALAPFIRSSYGEVVDEFRACVTELGPLAGLAVTADEETVARRFVLFGLSLRPALLAPAAGATSVLQAVSSLDALYPAMGRVRQAVAGFGALNIELSPSVLKGVRDHASWEQELQAIRERARAWLSSNRQSKIIYAATTNVWHQWLEDDGPLGSLSRVVIDDRRVDRGRVRESVREWSDPKKVEKTLHATDQEIRGNGARRNPIEARARNGVSDRTQECICFVANWLDHIDSEPQVLDDYRQRQADEVRAEVVAALPAALVEAERATGGTKILAAAAAFVGRALRDLQRLFDPNQDEVAETPAVRVLLGEELLAEPGIDLGDDWHPQGAAEAGRLHQLLALESAPYDPESAFRANAEVRNHVRTEQVIESLYARNCQLELVHRLREERTEQIRLCRKDFQQQLAATRAKIEQAVCYDLIGGDDRSRCSDMVEAYGAGIDDILNFGRATADLTRINAELDARREERVAHVTKKLETLARDGVPADRQSDVEVIRNTLAQGDFLSAEEYLELVRNGQPLTRVAVSVPSVLTEFFTGSEERQGFVRRFEEYMNVPGRTREVPDRVRRAESVGPISMDGVAKPQAEEAARMIEAWIRLKESKEKPRDTFRDELTILLTGFGFKGVTVDSILPVKPPHWLAVCQTVELNNPADCIVPHYGSLAHGRYRVLGVYDRPNEDSLVQFSKELPGTEPLIVLYFGRMTEQRRRDLAEFSRARSRGFLTVDECLVYFLCGARFSRLPILFQCALPFTVAKPYTTTASLVPVEMFFGRQREREQVTAIDGTNLVYGGRQLGKSALLRDIEKRNHNPAAGQIVRWIDLKNLGIGIDRPAEDIWVEIGQELHQAGVLAGLGKTHKTVAERVKEWLQADESRRILLLLDEADAFFEMDSQPPVRLTRQSYPEVARLKGLMDDTNRRFKVVFAGLHNVQRAARDPNTPLGHLGTPVCIGPLLDNGEWKQARNLIEVPLRHMGYELNPPDLWMRILSYTNYYPSLIQVFCKHLLESLHNKDQTPVDFRRCPPYRITADQVERVYQSRNLRSEVSHKFELTLGLDPRYRLIALEIALDSLIYPGGRADGVDVAWVRTQALADWPNGFAQTDRGYELFRTILDEMVGLGILRRAGEDRYALRSPNVLNLLGSREQIESKLIDVMMLPQPPVYDAATFRRSLNGNRWDHSPFTAEQEATLTEQTNGVVVVFASRLSGLDRLTDGLEGIPNLAGVVVAERMTQMGQFEVWLRDVDLERAAQSEGVTLAAVLPSSTWSAEWVRRAADMLRRKKGARKRFLRVVFVADPSAAWSCLAEDDLRSLGATEMTIRPWQQTALRRWVDEVEFSDPHNVCEAIRSNLGGWYSLVREFAGACRDNPQIWPDALNVVRASWPSDSRWHGYCHIPVGAREVMSVMADFGDPIRPLELDEFASPVTVRRVLAWADRFAYINRVDDEKGERWRLDTIVSDYLIGGGE